MDRSIVKDNHGFLLYLKRESVKISHKPVCIDGFLCPKAFILIPSGNHAKDIKSCCFQGWNIDILIFELPSVRYIHDFHQRNKLLFYLWNQGFQVLATSLSCMCRIGVRVYPWALYYFAYILHQCS